MIPSPTTRRRFLATSAQALLGVGIASQGLSWITGCSSTTATDPSQIWKDLDALLTGDLLLPGSMAYFDFAKPWALQYAVVPPAGIARCVSEADVQTCITWAKKNGVALVARSGGHSYAAYSQTSGLLVDVSLMNSVAYDATTGLGTLGGGARNRDVYAAMRPLGKAVTHGRCKNVGVAGLVLGGGIGFNMRAHGLTCDKLVSTRIVTADGVARNCSATENTDLFWAIRGAGGGNFGIHTQFVFAPFTAPDLVVFNISWDVKLEEVFAALQQVVISAPVTLGSKVSVVVTPQSGLNRIVVNLLGQLAGTTSELSAVLQPVYSVATPSASTIREMSYWDGQEFLSEEGSPEYSHERSRFAPTPLAAEGIAAIFRNIRAWPGTSVAGTWKFFTMGGVINDVSPTDTAFVHRSVAFVSSIELEWLSADQGTLLERNFAWLDAFHQEMEAYTSMHCYQNFIDRKQVNYLDAYYGENLDRLKRVKQLVDPTNIFTYPQAIPVT